MCAVSTLDDITRLEGGRSAPVPSTDSKLDDVSSGPSISLRDVEASIRERLCAMDYFEGMPKVSALYAWTHGLIDALDAAVSCC
jgi:hypothetical protein